MSELMVSIDLELVIPDFMDASVPLHQIGERFVKDIKANIRNQTDYETGEKYARLKKVTIDKKKKLGIPYPTLPLYRYGIMFNAIHSYKINKNAIGIGIIPRGKPARDKIANYHNEGFDNHSWYVFPRRFFGVSTKMLEYASERMDRWVKQNIEKAAKKYINLKF